MKVEQDVLEEACMGKLPIYALFSGGHDSLVSTFQASQHRMFAGVVHINTGIGIEETRQFVRNTCKAYGWPLTEMFAAKLKKPQVYEDIVRKYGFPGPAAHSLMYRLLKERALREFKAQVASRKPLVLCTGSRRQEGKKRQRMAYVMALQRLGQWIWVAPCVEWEQADVEQCMRVHSLPRNPVKDKMCISGECLCGAYARYEERAEIRDSYPDTDAELSRIEAIAAEAGVPSVWGKSPSRDRLRSSEEVFMPLCSDCVE